MINNALFGFDLHGATQFLLSSTGDNAHCVLCQQTLDAEAKGRLARFEAFVTDDTKQQEHRALSNFQQQHGELSSAQLSLTEVSQFVTFCKEELSNTELAKEVRIFFLKGKWRLRALLKLQGALPNAPVWPKAIFDNEKTQLVKRVTVLTLEDCQLMRDAYGRCSSWLHSSGVGLNSNLPSADDIQKEISVLKSWYDGLRQKQKSVAVT